MTATVTSTFYGEAADGELSGAHAVYLTARSTSSASSIAGATFRVGQAVPALYEVYRGYLSFDTSGIPDDAVVISATLFVCASSDSSAADFSVQVYRFAWEEALNGAAMEANYDGAYGASATLEGTLRDTALGWVADTYYSMSVATAGVNRTGDTKYALVSSLDVAGTAPLQNGYVSAYAQEQAGMAKDPYLLVVYKTQAHRSYPVSSAPGGPPLISVYDRANTLLSDPWALTAQASGLQYSSVVPGGFESCSFALSQSVREELVQREACRIAIRCGMQTAWEGRLSEFERKKASRQASAFGIWEHLKQRRMAVLTAAAGEHGCDLLYRVLPNAPLVSTDYADIGEQNFNLGGKTWANKDLQSIIVDIMASGDDQTPPREWKFSLWEIDALPSSGSVNLAVNAGAHDGYEWDDGSVGSYNGTVLRVGYQSPRHHVNEMIFSPVAIPRYAHIISATLGIYGKGALGANNPVIFNTYAEDVGTPADVSAAAPIFSRACTSAVTNTSMNWPAGDGWIAGGIDVTAQVQEVVNRGDWSSGNDMGIIMWSTVQAGLDTRKQFEAWEHADAHEETLAIVYAPPTGMVFAFHPEFIPRPAMTLDNVDYVIRAADVEGDLSVTPSLEELYNSVVARYGAGPSYTAAAEDAASISLYDKRENDPDSLDAGSTGTLAQAENLRDMYLAAHKDPIWKASDINVTSLRSRWGNFVNPACVRAGCVIRLVDFPTFDPAVNRVFYVVRASYTADSRMLTLSPEMPPDTLDIYLKRIQEAK